MNNQTDQIELLKNALSEATERMTIALKPICDALSRAAEAFGSMPFTWGESKKSKSKDERHYFLTHGKHGLKRPRGKRNA